MKGSFNVRISPDLHQKAAMVSSKQGVSLNQFVQKAIENSLANIPKATGRKIG